MHIIEGSSWLIRVGLLILSAFFIFFLSILLLTPYELFIIKVLSSVGKLHRINDFQQQYLTPAKFVVLRVVVVAIVVVVLIFTFFIWSKTVQITICLLRLVRILRQKVISHTSSFSLSEYRAILIVWFSITAVNFYNCISLPISYDEAWTYLNLSSKNLLVSASYYPAPNNHIFFSLLTNISSWLPIDPKIAIRLPNFIISSVSFFIILIIFKEIFYSSLAIILTTLLYSFYPVMLYSVHARGYLLYMLFAMLVFYFFYKNRYLSNNGYWVCFGIAAGFGFYTIPSFLYAFLTVFIIAFIYFLSKKDIGNSIKLIATSSLIATGVLILYTPVFIVSGVGAVANNSFIQQKSFFEISSYVPEHLIQTANWYMGNIYGYTYIGIGLLLIITIALSFLRKEKRVLGFSIFVAFICPAVFMLLHRTLPFERTWSYAICFVVLCIGLLANLLFTPVHLKKSIYIYCFSILTAGISLFNKVYSKNYAIDYDSKSLAAHLIANNCHKLYIQSDYQEVLLYYYYYTNQQVYEVDNGFAGVALDISKNYDCLIMDKNITPQINMLKYHPINISTFTSVYRKNK